MTGRTHDLAAFTAVNLIFVTQTVPHMSLASVGVAFGANMIGGLLPDIDNATSDLWDKVRGGNILAKLIKPLIGKHRMLSHSIVGMAIVGYLLKHALSAMSSFLIVDMSVVWWAFMIGYASHLITDTLTTEGVPWFFPIPLRLGFPPTKESRIKTGGFVEHFLFYPGLWILNGYLVYTHYERYLAFLKSYIQ